MAAFEVESNVPVPQPENGSGGELKYPWDEMEHSDSFFVPLSGDERQRVYRRVINSGKAWLKRHKDDHELRARFCTENGLEGYRIWMKDANRELPLSD